VEITGDEIRRRMVEAESLDPGGLRITGARITGQLDLSDVVAKRPLVLQNCRADLPVVLDRAQFTHLDLTGLVAPSVQALGLTVDHDLRLTGAQLTGDGLTFDGTRMRIGGGAHFDAGFTTPGAVRLNSSRISGALIWRGARIGSTLHLVDVQVGDAIFLSDGFHAAGDGHHAAVRMRGARIDGQLILRGGRFGSLDIRYVRVGKDLLMPFEGIEGPVRLEGLVYEGLPRDATVDEWMSLLARRTPYYSAQPWIQLAAAHQSAGNERDVRRIRVAAQRDLRRRGQLSRWGRIWHLVRGVTVGHG
jgi:hypothetical protein